MKKYLWSAVLFTAIVSCNDNNADKNATGADGESQNPTAIDTTQHPTGVTNSSVISTDTAAMRVDTTKLK